MVIPPSRLRNHHSPPRQQHQHQHHPASMSHTNNNNNTNTNNDSHHTTNVNNHHATTTTTTMPLYNLSSASSQHHPQQQQQQQQQQHGGRNTDYRRDYQQQQQQQLHRHHLIASSTNSSRNVPPSYSYPTATVKNTNQDTNNNRSRSSSSFLSMNSILLQQQQQQQASSSSTHHHHHWSSSSSSSSSVPNPLLSTTTTPLDVAAAFTVQQQQQQQQQLSSLSRYSSNPTNSSSIAAAAASNAYLLQQQQQQQQQQQSLINSTYKDTYLSHYSGLPPTYNTSLEQSSTNNNNNLSSFRNNNDPHNNNRLSSSSSSHKHYLYNNLSTTSATSDLAEDSIISVDRTATSMNNNNNNSYPSYNNNNNHSHYNAVDHHPKQNKHHHKKQKQKYLPNSDYNNETITTTLSINNSHNNNGITNHNNHNSSMRNVHEVSQLSSHSKRMMNVYSKTDHNKHITNKRNTITTNNTNTNTNTNHPYVYGHEDISSSSSAVGNTKKMNNKNTRIYNHNTNNTTSGGISIRHENRNNTTNNNNNNRNTTSNFTTASNNSISHNNGTTTTTSRHDDDGSVSKSPIRNRTTTTTNNNNNNNKQQHRSLQVMPAEARVALAKVILHYLQHKVVCETLLLDAIQKTGLSQEAIRHAVHVAYQRQNPQMQSQLLSTVQQTQTQTQLPTNDTTATTAIRNNNHPIMTNNNNNRIRSTTTTTNNHNKTMSPPPNRQTTTTTTTTTKSNNNNNMVPNNNHSYPTTNYVTSSSSSSRINNNSSSNNTFTNNKKRNNNNNETIPIIKQGTLTKKQLRMAQLLHPTTSSNSSSKQHSSQEFIQPQESIPSQQHGNTLLTPEMKKFQHISWGILTIPATNTTYSSGVVGSGKQSNNNNYLGPISAATTMYHPSSQKNKKQKTSYLIKMAQKIQKSLLLQQQQQRKMTIQSSSSKQTKKGMVMLVDPVQYKRVKLQPRREWKLLEKKVRKQRAQICDGFSKKHKEFHKQLMNHVQHFYKLHRQRKVDCLRRAKDVRNYLNTEEKKQTKQAEHAEKARIAALRANDMKAYAKLLEQARNERLKFLMDKTEECMKQISTLIQNQNNHQLTTTTTTTTGVSTNDDGSNNELQNNNEDETTISQQFPHSSSYYSTAHVKSEEVKQPSILVGGQLKDYQVSGLHWMVSLYNNKLNGILADEMGLGKTIQTIALISYLKEKKDNHGPYLVIVPLSTLSNWVNEFKKWCPSMNVVAYKGIKAQRKELYRNEVHHGQFNVLLTTYEYIIKDKARLRKIIWQYAIVDEGHRMKNADSKFAVTLGTKYTTQYRILLTGTPLQNSLPELWALLNFLLPTVFNSVETFDEWFNKPFAQFGGNSNNNSGDQKSDTEDGELSNEERMLIIHRLHEVLRPFMLRRVKSEVLDQLPEKTEKVLRCELSSWQKALYKQISLKANQEMSENNGGGGGVMRRGINNIVMQLRKVCNHPFLFSPDGYYINEDIIRTSGKVELLDRILPKLKAAGHRILMFFQMTAVMSIMEDFFTYRNYTYLRLDGSTPADERAKSMEAFNAPDSPYFLFLLSTRAGGLGLNLATADTVIIFDSDWNPMMDLQAQDRAHRIGQKKNVRVFRLITNSPVEEKILSRAAEKLNMSELVVEAGKFDRSSVDEDKSEERLKRMEVLLTDFDTSTVNNNMASTNSLPSTDDEGEQDIDIDVGAEVNLNEQLSRDDEDYRAFCKYDEKVKMDEEHQNDVHKSPGLISDPDDIPDWIRYPNKKKGNESCEDKKEESTLDINDPPLSKRRAGKTTVRYNDGLTDYQFCKLMEQQADILENGSKPSSIKNKKKQITEYVAEEDDDDCTFKRNTKPTKDIKKEIIVDKVTTNVLDMKKNQDDHSDGFESSDSNTLNESEKLGINDKKREGSDRSRSKQFNSQMSSICTSIINLKEPSTKRQIAELFMFKPCPETYPDYYEYIDDPITINDIKSKCKASIYSDANEFLSDWNLLFSNARFYNEDGSLVAQDADTLESLLHKLLRDFDIHDGETKDLNRQSRSSKKSRKSHSSVKNENQIKTTRKKKRKISSSDVKKKRRHR